MNTATALSTRTNDWALLFLRVTGSLLLMLVHGVPKVLNLQAELGLIEDPFGLGPHLTLSLAIFAEVLCPLLIAGPGRFSLGRRLPRQRGASR